MKRVMLHGPGRLEVQGCEAPLPGPGEVLVDVAYCGICGSDLHSFRGEHPLVIYPVTPGHEFSGVVANVGDGVDTDLVGRGVCIEPSLFCGRCPQCESGRYNICTDLRVMGFQAPGAMCDRVAVPLNRVHVLPTGVDLIDGALAEPAAVGVHAVSRSGIEAGDRVLVVGAGVIGLMVLAVARAIGCEVDVVEGGEGRAERAKRFGAGSVTVFSGREDNLVQGVQYAAVFECVGKAETIDLAIRSAPRGGTVVAVGVPPGPVPVDMALVQDGELDVRGTLMYRSEDFERALRLIADGAIGAKEFVSHRIEIDEVEGAYQLAGEAADSTLKVILEISRGEA